MVLVQKPNLYEKGSETMPIATSSMAVGCIRLVSVLDVANVFVSYKSQHIFTRATLC